MYSKEMIPLAKPVLYSIKAFDATKDHVFTFRWNGGSLKRCKIVIKDNVSGVTKCELSAETMRSQITMPANSVLNQKTPYNIVVTAVYVSSDGSEAEATSDPEIFYCFATPVFYVNMSNEQQVQNSSYTVDLTYSQTQSEELNEYRFILYGNDSTTVADDSGSLYNSQNRSYSLSNLEDNSRYYLRVTGETVNGMICDTGKIPFVVQYLYPISYTDIEIENRSLYGDIMLNSNYVSVDGTKSANGYFVDGNTKLNLTDNGAYCVFDSGYSIGFEKNFKSILDFSGVVASSVFYTMAAPDGTTIKVALNTSLFDGNDKPQTYLMLTERKGNLTRVIVSNYIEDYDISSTNLRMSLVRNGAYYSLKLIRL